MAYKYFSSDPSLLKDYFIFSKLFRLNSKSMHPSILRIIMTLLFASLLLQACKEEKEINSLQNVAEVSGPIEPPQSSWYKAVQSYETNGENKFIGYNEAAHSLDYFDFKNGVVVFNKSVKLALEGPDKIEEVRGFIHLGGETLIVCTRNYILELNDLGEIIERVNIATSDNNSLEGLDLTQCHPYVRQAVGNRPFVFDQALYMGLNHYALEQAGQPVAQQEEISLFCRYNFDNENFEHLPIYYPDFLQEIDYGFGSSVNMLGAGTELIYYFIGFPNVYAYDLINKRTRIISEDSTLPKTLPTEGMDTEIHLQKMVMYADAVIDPSGENLYQVVLLPKSIDNEVRKIFIRTVNLQTGYEEISPFPRRHAFHGMLTYADGLYLPQMGEQEDEIAFTIVK